MSTIHERPGAIHERPGTSPEQPGTAAAYEALEWGKRTLEPALREAVDTLPEDMRHVARYHFGWADEHGNPVDVGGGKAVRPTLVLLCARAVGGSAEEAVPAAVAVELVHNFSLIHDDVMDRDTHRRHRRTAWSVFGVDAAILVGDALSSLATGVLADSGHTAALLATRQLNTAVQRLIEGQIMDVAFEDRVDVGLAECESMVRGKTGALLGAACELGALFGRADTETAEQLRAFGEDVGLAFQHTDDLLGIWGDPEVTGKSAYSDLYRRKKSLPVVAALTSENAAGSTFANTYHQNVGTDEAVLAELAELVDAAGGRAWSTVQADTLLARSLDVLTAVLSGQEVDSLAALAQLATRRDR